MNKIFGKPQLTPYEADYARWCAEQGALLREGNLQELDRENLAEEIESSGRSDKREIESRLNVLLVHLLKWRFQPDQRAGSWKATITEQRWRISRVVKDSPSLNSYPRKVLAEEYALARSNAATETGLFADAFPSDCTFSIGQVLDLEFFPE
ncbi:DUF29 domain-containing protein [Aminobacter sp. P9b]|uniref:DUF29 domain-containing protein n=1 Tax=Aminobacter sp. P9b TaxID=3133697 RepID=UPI0032467BBF